LSPVDGNVGRTGGRNNRRSGVAIQPAGCQRPIPGRG